MLIIINLNPVHLIDTNMTNLDWITSKMSYQLTAIYKEMSSLYTTK